MTQAKKKNTPQLVGDVIMALIQWHDRQHITPESEMESAIQLFVSRKDLRHLAASFWESVDRATISYKCLYCGQIDIVLIDYKCQDCRNGKPIAP